MQYKAVYRTSLLAAGIMALSLSAASVAPALAQAQIAISGSAYGAVRELDLELNKSMIVDLPAGVAEVIVSQPNVAAAIMRTRTRAIIQGVTGGDTNVFFLDDNGRTIQVLDLRVIEQPSQVGNALEDALARVIPGSRIRVESVTLGGDTNRVVLTGTVLSAEDRDRAIAVATQFAGGEENVASILDVAGAQQVMLQVTISEVRRDVARQLGINLSGTATIGNASIGFNAMEPASTLPVMASNTIAGSFFGGDVRASIEALEGRGAARVLAQPTLSAISGAEADFLVGGEIRYQSGVDPNTGEPIYTFRDYGIQLGFTPTVKSNGTVSLVLDTEVSEPAANNTLATRRASTTVELPAGTSLSIAGLLDERSAQSISQLPVLGDIPILGALFRSREYQTQQTELVILVTPYLVAPSPANTIAVPTDTSTMASDAEGIFLGRLEHMYGVGSTGEFRGGFSGSVGFVLD